MCGDSTSEEDLAKLVGDDLVDLIETDPPYNVDYHSSKGESIENDSHDDDVFYRFLVQAFSNANYHLKEGGAFYIWHADSNGLIFRQAATDSGLTIKQNLVWIKNTFTIGRQDYQWRHEPCLYGWKEGAAHYFIDMRSLSTANEYDRLEDLDKDELVYLFRQLLDDTTTVQHADKPAANDLHPTMKPLTLIKKHVRNSSREGETVLDLFGGSGTTLIACEQMNRRCLMMEYDPKYAERIIRRWEEETNEKATVLK